MYIQSDSLDLREIPSVVPTQQHSVSTTTLVPSTDALSPLLPVFSPPGPTVPPSTNKFSCPCRTLEIAKPLRLKCNSTSTLVPTSLNPGTFLPQPPLPTPPRPNSSATSMDWDPIPLPLLVDSSSLLLRMLPVPCSPPTSWRARVKFSST
jgi:hypothetical protein